MPLDPREHRVGRLIDEMEVDDLDRNPVKLSSFRGRTLVICMTSPDCPVARKYLPVLAALEREYVDRGIAFLAVNTRGSKSTQAMRNAIAACGFAGQCVSKGRDGRGAAVPAGARLKVTAWYDNSEKNPANPDPAATVGFGDQTWDEMMIGYFSGYRLK